MDRSSHTAFICQTFFLLCQCEKDDSDTVPPSPNYADSVKAGLWAYYTFDGTLADQSGNNHNGTGYNNIQFTYDIWGNDNKALNLMVPITMFP